VEGNSAEYRQKFGFVSSKLMFVWSGAWSLEGRGLMSLTLTVRRAGGKARGVVSHSWGGDERVSRSAARHLAGRKGRSASGSQMERKRWSTTRVDATNVCVWGSGDRENFRRSLPCVLAAPHLVQIERVETKTPTGTSATERRATTVRLYVNGNRDGGVWAGCGRNGTRAVPYNGLRACQWEWGIFCEGAPSYDGLWA
jgi:hypothetical protein